MPEETDRLDSWKQIAAYLQKSERTVRRWHEIEGLPVHKHQHLERGSVWGYQGEIDAWLEQRRVGPAPPQADGPEPIAASPSRRSLSLSMWLALAGTALAAAGGAFWLVRDSQPPQFAKLPDPIALTTLPGVEIGPSFSPDGKQLAFFWSGPRHEATGREVSGIYTKTVGAESVTPLVVGLPGFVYGPAWSPDGKTIAFLQRTETLETWLCLVASSGGTPKRLIRLHDKSRIFSANNRQLDWSLDSQRILAPLQVGEGKQAIHWIAVATAAAQRVTEATFSDEAPAASPDRRSLVFLRHRLPAGGEQNLLLQRLNRDGSADGPPWPLIQGRAFISGVAWAPGGKDVIVCKAESVYNLNSLYRMRARPGDPLIPIRSDECSGVEVSRADEKGQHSLVYARNQEPNVQLWKASLKNLEHGSAFAPSSRSDTFPAFSPDGASVAFRSTRSGAGAVWIANQDGTQPRRLSDLPLVAGSIEWSPDGSQVLFSAGQAGLAILPLTGGAPTLVAGGGSPPRWPHWSHGSGFIYYFSENRLFQMRGDGSGSRAVGAPRLYPSAMMPVVRSSPDGKTLFLSRMDGLYRRPATADGAEELIEPKLFSLSLAATRTTLYYLRQEDKALYGLPFAGGPPKKIGVLQPFNKNGGNLYSGIFTVSADDRSIVWTVGNSREVDLELVANFR